jgi:hypothetical protein
MLTLERPELAWIGEETNHFGTDEFLKWCEVVGTEPYLCLNFGTGQYQKPEIAHMYLHRLQELLTRHLPGWNTATLIAIRIMPTYAERMVGRRHTMFVAVLGSMIIC